MNPDDTQYQEFLEELNDLADFRLNYALDYNASKLDKEDSDVKRIIEALAFFGARTHLAALRSLDATHRRLYQQFFSYLLTPLASMAMIQAKPNGHLTEVMVLSEGTEFELQPEKGEMVMLCTTRPLRILPMELVSVKQEPGLSGKGCRLLLSFQANYPLNAQPETLSLHINYLNDYALSLKVFHFLGQSLKNAGVQYGVYDTDQACTPCQFSLGVPDSTIEIDDWNHPMEKERYFFHFPQQELYLALELPSAPRNWTRFTVALDCDELLPRQLRLHRDLFQLFTVPLVNNQRSMAQPIICDGTQERYTLRHPQPEFGFCLQKVLGVYEVTKQGMLPFRPGILAGGNGSYEIEQGLPREGGGHLYWLVPHFPSAFEEPRTLVIEALWQQPWYDQYLKKNYTLSMFRRQVQGIKWELVDTAIPHAENQPINTNTGYIHLLTLMHKACFNFQNTRDLLMALGSVSSSRFQTVFNSFVDVRMEEESLGGAERRITRQIYTLRFKKQSDKNIELIETFVRHVGRVLNLWITDALVETSWESFDELNSTFLGEK